MVALFRRQRLNLPVAPLAAGMIGAVVAVLFALMPTGMLEDLVVDSGLAAVFSAAEPPLGFTARMALILLCGGGVGMIAWFALILLLGNRAIVIQPAGDADADERIPVLRRADAHPDAPARRPLSALRDLGGPFPAERGDTAALPEDNAAAAPLPIARTPQPERAVPADLDQPLAAFDPGAIRDDPADWFPAPPPLKPLPRRQTFAPSERLETFALSPAAPKAPAPAAPRPPGDPSASIHALLDRLERSVGKSEPAAAPAPPPPAPRADSLEDALVTLRRLATRP